MTNSQAKSELMQIYMSLSEEKKQALDMAFKAMEQADGEYISRQAVIDCYKKWQPYMATRLHEFEKELLQLPSVAIPSAEPNITWVTGADEAKVAFWDVPVWKVTKICKILGESQESEV